MCPKFSNPKIQNFKYSEKKRHPLCEKKKKKETLTNTILISANCRHNAVNKSHDNSQNGIWKTILSEINLQRSLRTKRPVHDYWCTKILVLSYLGAHLTFESHSCILCSFLKRTEVLGPRAAPSYTRERWREYDPRSGGRWSNTGGALVCFEKDHATSVSVYVLSTLFDDLILAAYSLGQ